MTVPGRRFYPSTIWIDARLIARWDAQVESFRKELFMLALKRFCEENEARKAQGLKPLRKLLLRHFDDGNMEA